MKLVKEQRTKSVRLSSCRCAHLCVFVSLMCACVYVRACVRAFVVKS